MAEHPERPPHPRRRRRGRRVVDDDRVVVVDAQPLHRVGEHVRGRQHVGEVAADIADPVDVEEFGAGDVLVPVFGAGIAAGPRQVEAAVEHPDVRVVEVLGQPRGGSQRLWVHVVHRAHSSQSGAGSPIWRRKVGLNILLW